jgi:hypothetical protein
VPSSTPTNGNNQHTVFYILGLWLDEWEGFSSGTVGINAACFNFPGPPCSYFRYLNENVRCHGDQYLYTYHTHTHTHLPLSASQHLIQLYHSYQWGVSQRQKPAVGFDQALQSLCEMWNATCYCYMMWNAQACQS